MYNVHNCISLLDVYFMKKKHQQTGNNQNKTNKEIRIYITVKAPVSGHPQEVEKVSATGAGRLRECVNT